MPYRASESDDPSRWEVGTLYRAHWRRAPILDSLVHLGEMVVQSLQSNEDRAREQCRKENVYCTLHYSQGCMHCELNVTGPSPSDGGEVGGGVVVVVGMV